MQLTSLQLRILVKLALPGRMTLERLLAAAMPRKLDINQRPLMENEIRLQIDLLALHGLISLVDQSGERCCVAPTAVVRWLAKSQPTHISAWFAPTCHAPLVAQVLPDELQLHVIPLQRALHGRCGEISVMKGILRRHWPRRNGARRACS